MSCSEVNCPASPISDEVFSFAVTSPVKLISSSHMWLAVVLVLMIQLYEIFLFHAKRMQIVHRVSQRWNSESVWANLPERIKFRYSLFATRRFPLSTMILSFGPLLVTSSAAWMGILDRENWTGRILQMLLLWSSCMPVTLLMYNTTCLIKYLPCTTNEWLRCVKVPSWWCWVFAKILFGGPDPHCILFTGLWYVTTTWVVWPFRYFFYYRATTLAASQQTADVFVINMVWHLALLVGWFFYLHNLAFGVCTWVSNRFPSQFWAQISLAVALSSVLCIIRVFWFLFTNLFVLGFWGSWVVLGFLHVHIFALFGYLPIFTALLQKKNTSDHLRESFVKSYTSSQLKIANDNDDGKLTSVTAEKLNSDADAFFDKLLDATCTRFAFQEKSDDKEQKPEQQDSNKDKDAQFFLDCMLSIVASANIAKEFK